jgi:actin-related protein 3
MTHRPPIIMDNGTGYTKLGYAGTSHTTYSNALQHRSPSTGNPEPSFVIPSCIAVDDSVGSASTGSVATKKGALSHAAAKFPWPYASLSRISGRIDDLDFYIGDEALQAPQNYSNKYCASPFPPLVFPPTEFHQVPYSTWPD